jgi:hypothetical protein
MVGDHMGILGAVVFVFVLFCFCFCFCFCRRLSICTETNESEASQSADEVRHCIFTVGRGKPTKSPGTLLEPGGDLMFQTLRKVRLSHTVSHSLTQSHTIPYLKWSMACLQAYRQSGPPEPCFKLRPSCLCFPTLADG